MSIEMYDVIIIGGGPAGSSAALVLARAMRKVLLIDAGTPRNYASKAMHGYLGFDGVDPLVFRNKGRQELEALGIEILRDEVIDIRAMSPSSLKWKTCFEVATLKKRVALSRKVLFTTGVVDVLPDIAGIKQYYGSGVHHCPYCDAFPYRNQHILAVGGNAQDAAGLGLTLRGWTEQVTVLTNGEVLNRSAKELLCRNKISLVVEKINEIIGENGSLTGVRLSDGKFVSASALFFNTKHPIRSSLPESLGCPIKEDETACATEKQGTNVDGVFIAGDADGDVQFIVVAAAEGATAAVAINSELQREDFGKLN
jgi:thioredoxin reductase